MLRFYPLLIRKGGSFRKVFKADPSLASDNLVKEFAVLFGQTKLRGLPETDSTPNEPMVRFLNKEPLVSNRIQAAAARKEHILKLMKEMPKTIANWKQERKAAREAAKPKYPF